MKQVGSNKAGSRKALLVSSSGGHWIQLNRLRPCFDNWTLAFVCTNAEYAHTLQPGERFYTVPEATRWNKFRLIFQALKLLGILIQERPAVIVSTGAAPGFFAVVLGRMFRCKTIWIDSIANVDEMSLSGRHARLFADLWLTQWPHLADTPSGPSYFGSVV